ncbi:hypothetical protein Tco_0636341 [Tanacetum coccineum]
MADNRTMAQMLQAPIEGYEDAIVIPPINANNFELKQPLINLVQNIQKFSNTSGKLCFSFFSKMVKPRLVRQGTPRSISLGRPCFKIIIQYFPPSKPLTIGMRSLLLIKKPTSLQTKMERFKGLLRQFLTWCSGTHQSRYLFYNSLNSTNQDALDSAQAVAISWDKMPQEGFKRLLKASQRCVNPEAC